MNDRSKNRPVRRFSGPLTPSWSLSRRAFIGMLGAAGVVFAQERTAPLAKDVTGFLNDDNPVNLAPRLSPLPEAVAGVAQPCLNLNGIWLFNPDPGAEFWKGGPDAGFHSQGTAGSWKPIALSSSRGLGRPAGQASLRRGLQ